MDEETPPQGDITEEFRNLSKNLIETLRAAWDTPDRKRLSQELESGLDEMASTLRSEILNFRESPTGQRMKSEVEGIQQRVSSGEIAIQVRGEIIKTLKMINTELKRVSSQWSEPGADSQSPSAPPAEEDSSG